MPGDFKSAETILKEFSKVLSVDVVLWDSPASEAAQCTKVVSRAFDDPEFASFEGLVLEIPSWRPVRESNPCRRREREAICRNSKETCGMDSTVR